MLADLDLDKETIVAGRFVIEGVAGRGAMGVVYRAWDRETSGLVALKVLSEEPSRVVVERFAREARALSDLRHPGSAAYIDHGSLPDRRPYLAMEWLEGEDLDKRLARGPLPGPSCIRLLRNAAAALAEAHRIEIIHRDIKPSNIFLYQRQFHRIVILDFGISRRASGEPTLTASGLLVGTPEYMSPEQVRAQSNIGPPADIFSLGCVLYQCVTGRSPFLADQLGHVLDRILHEDLPPLAIERPDVPRKLSSLIDRMLSKSAGDRPQDGAALYQELIGERAITPGEAETIG